MGRLLKANVIALLILTSLVIAYYSPYTPYKTRTSISTPIPTTSTPALETDTTDTSISTLILILEKINKERQKFGVPPARFFYDPTARFRATDMYNNEYFGHCDLDGMTPNYHYTKLGGSYVIEENVGYFYVVGWKILPINYNVVELVDGMIYRDADSNWGHRDSILDPTNNYVSVYAIWDKRRLFLVIHMMKIWVEWVVPPTIRNDVFIAEGRILLNSSRLVGVIIYYSSPNTSRTYDPRLNILRTCSSYSRGKPVAFVVPEPYYYQEIQTIRPLKWVISGQYFNVEFPINFISKRGLYTITIWVENTLNTKHPFDKERYSDYLPILDYTLLIEK